MTVTLTCTRCRQPITARDEDDLVARSKPMPATTGAHTPPTSPPANTSSPTATTTAPIPPSVRALRVITDCQEPRSL